MKVKFDKVAYDIAVKARNLHVREAAKLRVRVQNLEHSLEAMTEADDFIVASLREKIIEVLAAADAKEALARGWDHKAQRALDRRSEGPYGRTELWEKNGVSPDDE